MAVHMRYYCLIYYLILSHLKETFLFIHYYTVILFYWSYDLFRILVIHGYQFKSYSTSGALSGRSLWSIWCIFWRFKWGFWWEGWIRRLELQSELQWKARSWYKVSLKKSWDCCPFFTLCISPNAYCCMIKFLHFLSVVINVLFRW